MKKKIISTLTIAALLLFPLFMIGQSTGPGTPGEEPEPGEDPIGGGAPIGNGIGVLMALGAAYGGKKLYTLYHNDKELLEE